MRWLGKSEIDDRERAAQHIDGFDARRMKRARDAARESQLDVWTRARNVAVVEGVGVETDVEIPQSPMGRGVRSTVKPVGWLKGGSAVKKNAARASFVLGHVSFTSCGASPNWPIFSGKAGGRFLVFLNADAPAQGAVLAVVAPGDVVLPELSQNRPRTVSGVGGAGAPAKVSACPLQLMAARPWTGVPKPD